MSPLSLRHGFRAFETVSTSEVARSFSLHLKINLRIYVGRRERNMPQPSPDRVDVYTGTEEVCRRRMPDYVWADHLPAQRGDLYGGTSDMAFHKCMDTESRQRPPAAIEEDMSARFTTSHQGCQCNRWSLLYRATTDLVSLASNQD